MALKLMLETLEGVDEVTRKLYTEKDGKFMLDVDGLEDTSGLKSALEKERQKARELEKAMAKFKDVDPDKYRELQKQLEALEEQGLKDAGKLDELLAKRTERMKADFENQSAAMQEALNKLKGENDTLKKNLTDTLVKKAVLESIAEVGSLRKEAVTDAVSRGLGTWVVNEKGALEPRKADGSIIYGKDGAAPMTMKEWAEGLLKDAPHFFQPSNGGGGSGSGQGGKGAGNYSPEEIARMTPQQKMQLARA